MKSILLILIITLILSACNSGGGQTSTPQSFTPSGTYLTASGTVTYDYVPITSSGLDYSSKTQRPIRNVRIEARYGSFVVANTVTDSSGAYSLSIPSNATPFYIAVISRMETPDIRIEDNTSSDALYLAASSSMTLTDNMVISNLNASSGWTGSNSSGSYSSTRVAAPFAILDSVYSAYLKIKADRPSITLPALKINWSKNNIATSGNISLGQIGTSYYDGSELYILGKENSDSDEYDRHVVVHEFGHFVEDKIGRSDSIGGEHSLGDRLHMSVAFGEGWGNAFSAMVFDPDITYRDSYGSGQQSAFGFSLESGTDTNRGWFSETSVQHILFDIYDSTNEGSDTLTLGIGPVLDVIMGMQKNTTGLTSIFSFIAGLKTEIPSNASALNTLTTSKLISDVQDEFGTGETNDGGVADSLPIFLSLPVNDTLVTTGMTAGSTNYNQIYNTRQFKFTSSSSSTRITWSATDSYRLYVLYKGGVVYQTSRVRTSSGAMSENTTISTTSGREYTVFVFVDPTEMHSPASPVTFTLKALAL